MKKIGLVLLMLASTAFAKEPAVQVSEANKMNLKKYGLARCLLTYHRTEPSEDIGMAVGGYFNISEPELYNIHFKAVSRWVNDQMDNHFIGGVAKSDGKRIEFMDCMDLYESKEYQAELDRIIKNYHNP